MNRSLVLGLWVLGLGICFWLTLRAPVLNDLNLFMPNKENWHPLLNQLRQGPASRLLLLGLEGDSAQVRARLSRRLAERLRREAAFVRVSNGELVLPAADRQLLLNYRYLLSSRLDNDEPFSIEALRRTLRQRLAELASPLSTWHGELLPRDPGGDFMSALKQLKPEHAPPTQYGAWFSPNQRYALLLLETRSSGFDPQAQQQAINRLKAHFRALDPPEEVALRISGPGMFSLTAKQVTRTETQLLSVAASLGILLILWLAYRHWRPLLLSALPLMSATLAAVAITSLIFGGIHGITLAFGVTLLGIVIDYPIHLFSHARENGEAAARHVRRVLILSALTTCLAYLTLATTEFNGLRQLGVFTASGILVGLGVTLWVLPAWVPALPVPPSRVPARTANFRLPWFGLGSLVGFSGALIVATWPGWENNLAKLIPLPESLIQLDHDLREALGAPEPSHLITLSGDNPGEVLQRTEALRPLLGNLIMQGEIQGYRMAADYLPSPHRQRQRQQKLPEREKLAGAMARASEGLGFKPGLFQAFYSEVARASELPPLTLERLPDGLLKTLAAPLLLQQAGQWHGLVLLAGVRDRKSLEQRLSTALPAEARYVDLRIETERLIGQFRDTGLSRVILGGVLISLFLSLALGSMRRAAITLAPVLAALTLSVLVLTLAGQRLGLFHLVSLLLVLGLAIDYTLFFQRDPNDAATRRALKVCAASSITVFGLLAFSSLPVLQAVGRTVTVGVIITLAVLWFVAYFNADKKPQEEKRDD